MAAFVQGGGYIPLSRGEAIIENAQNVNLGIAGALKFAQEAGWEIVPILWAGAIPSAPVTKDAYEAIVSEIVEGLKDCGPLDGIFIDLHGAMVAEHVDDGEGELLERVRAVRASEPLAVALDLHGNITRRMFDHADVMVGFRTYPHVDMAETGYRSAKALQALMGKSDGWHKAMRQGDYLIPIAWQCTDEEPAKGLYGMTVDVPEDVLTASLFMGFPAADFAECGPSVFAYGWDKQAVENCADDIMAALSAAEQSFAGVSYQPEEGLRRQSSWHEMLLVLSSLLIHNNPGQAAVRIRPGCFVRLLPAMQNVRRLAVSTILKRQTLHIRQARVRRLKSPLAASRELMTISHSRLRSP